jgi:D-alanyl-D-alanine carboxypeptidase/D-alanyl-D-alanine-endopeptidase (penicillin-binding protein 4)
MNVVTPKIAFSRFLKLFWLCYIVATPLLHAQDADSVDADLNLPEPVETRTARTLGEQIQDYLNRQSAGFTWGVKVQDLATGEVLFERNAWRALTPASNMKVFTTAAALDILGPDYQYRTDLYARGRIKDGVLEGDLFIRGSGDPSFGGELDDENNTMPTQPFFEWANALKNLGINTITGNIIGDDDIFDDMAVGEGWESEDYNKYYAAQISGLPLTENMVGIKVRGRGRGLKGEITWEPGNTNYVNIINDTNRGGGLQRANHSNTISVRTSVREGREGLWTIPIENPTLMFATVLKETLQRTGITVLGEAMDVDSLVEKPNYRSSWQMKVVASHYSSPLKDIVKIINKKSHNMYAEHLLKTVGAHASWDGIPRPGSAQRGSRAIKEFLRRIGADTEPIIIVDGSGLSRINKITPAAMVRILEYMWNHPNPEVRDAFYNSLSIAGIDGTLKKRMKSYPTMGNVHGKTGFISNVRSLSGYVQTMAGTPIAFALICNGFSSRSAVTNIQDNIVKLIAKFQR